MQAAEVMSELMRKHVFGNVQGMTQAETARRAGLSLPTIKSYERGKRRPSRTALEPLIGSLGIPKEAANQILAGAGYAIDWRTLFQNRYPPLSLDELESEAVGCAWPAFVTNESFDVIRPFADSAHEPDSFVPVLDPGGKLVVRDATQEVPLTEAQ